MRKIRGVVFDLAGTVCDPYCLSPLKAFARTFEQFGVSICSDLIRKPMGKDKMEHINDILNDAAFADTWRKAHGKVDLPKTKDVYNKFLPNQIESVVRFSDLVNGAARSFHFLKSKNIKIGATTGYSKDITNVLLPILTKKGFHFDSIVTSDEVEFGRPHPDMIFECMKKMGMHNPEEIMNVDDSAIGCLSAKNAGVFSVGVSDYSTHVKIDSRCELFSLSKDVLNSKREVSKKTLQQSSDAVIKSIYHLPDIKKVKF